MTNINIAKELRSSIKQGEVAKVTQIIEHDYELLNFMTPFGTWLHVASSEGKLEIVKKLVELGSDINRRGGAYDGGALNEAASKGHLEVVKYLLSCKADMDVSEPERNPLFGAISNGHADIARLLIQSGIDTTVKYSGSSMNNVDAITFAREQGQNEIVNFLEHKNGNSLSGRTMESNDHDCILEHIAIFFGSPQKTLREIIPGSNVSVNIHVIPLSQKNDFLTLVTTGMSDAPMDESSGASEFNYSELIIKLPSEWPVEDLTNQSEYSWPFSWLRKTAHIPHRFDGWLAEGVILPNGEPPRPFAANTMLSCIMVSGVQEPGLERLVTPQGKIINFYTLVPIYEEERNIALKNGYEYLRVKMNEKVTDDVLNINRPSIISTLQ